MPVATSSFRRRHLPHYDVTGATYFVTSCLAGSVPARGLLRPHAPTGGDLASTAAVSERERQALAEWFERQEDWLDFRAPVRWCADRRVAAIVRDAIVHFEGDRYVTLAYAIMPSHVHWVFQALAGWDRATILKSFKSFTARECNRVLARGGAFWQSESYDRVVRDDEECTAFMNYVEFNPVKAGLCARPEQWEFSSARK